MSRDVIINEKLSNGSEVFDLILKDDTYEDMQVSVADVSENSNMDSSMELNEVFSENSTDEYDP